MTHRRKRSPSHGKAEDFAAEYDPMQVTAHKDAVSLFERCANGGRERPYRPSKTILKWHRPSTRTGNRGGRAYSEGQFLLQEPT